MMNRFAVGSQSPFPAFPVLLSAMVVGSTVCSTGCREAPPPFPANEVRAMSLERSRDVPTQAALDDVELVITELFGTPTQPKWPAAILENEDQRSVVSMDNLVIAAGGVASDQADVHTGLYQEHCVICHGISGSGAGPASRYQIPYPRDFRAGVFKWKSTQRNEKPTRDDLDRLLVRGVPGAPMPSFAIVPLSERQAIIDYVIYLSIRGELERDLLAAAIDDLDYDTGPPDEDLRLKMVSVSTQGRQTIVETLHNIVDSWVDVQPASVPPRPTMTEFDLAASIVRGKEVFHGQIANCVGCHGVGGGGGLATMDYDDWTKDFTTRIGVSPDDRDAVKPFRKAGALPPRKIDPRVLAGGVLRGGGDPETIYRRIQQGIAGTPMPSLEISDEADGKTGLSVSQAWDLVAYIESLQSITQNQNTL